jgi:two-component system C4-dicarboxylate transport sensor histidine kinase DctB
MMAQNKTQVKFTAPLILSVVAVIILTGLFYSASSVFRTLELSQASAKLSLYRTTIENELQRLEHLPVIVADKITVRNAVQSRPSARLNQELLALSQDARAEAIYVMDVQGMTIAASNFAKTPTFLGKNYGFRQYFQEAMQGKRASLFAIGATTSRAGYFLSAPILRSGTPIGVAVVKLDLTRLTKILEQTNEMILVSNKDDIVVLSSRPEWRYRSLTALNVARRAEISEERQFGEEKLQVLNWEMPSQNTAVLDGQEFLSLQAQLQNPFWTIRYLGDTRAIRERALLVVAVAAGMMALSALAFLAWRSGRLRFALAASQKDRKRLQREIEVRRQAERRLTRAQEELKRSSKLAALGQLAASVTHELGQPISAMKNYLIAEEIAGEGAQSGLTGQLSSIVARMENITKQLRFFASDRGEDMAPVALQNVLRGALNLLQHDLDESKIALVQNLPEQDMIVMGNQQRLEQVVINVVRNAIMAVEDLADRQVVIDLEKMADGQVVLSIADTGTGLQGQTIDQLSEPFHTTRSSGEGMGLGLAISASIIQEHGGSLTAKDAKGGGAEFVITLPELQKDV